MEEKNDAPPKRNVCESARIFKTRRAVHSAGVGGCGKVSTFKSIYSHVLRDQKHDLGG